MTLSELGLVGGEVTLDTLKRLRPFAKLHRLTLDNARLSGTVEAVSASITAFKPLGILRLRDCEGPTPEWIGQLKTRLEKDLPTLHVVVENGT